MRCPGSRSWRIVTPWLACLPWGLGQQKGLEARRLPGRGSPEAARWLLGCPRKADGARRLPALEAGGAAGARGGPTRTPLGHEEVGGETTASSPHADAGTVTQRGERGARRWPRRLLPAALKRHSRGSDEAAPARWCSPRCEGLAPSSSPALTAAPGEALHPQGHPVSCFLHPDLPFFRPERSSHLGGAGKDPGQQ